MPFQLIYLPKPLTAFQHCALEEWLVRHLDCSKNDFLLLYINQPCVVVGKNQSVYCEVNFDFWNEHPELVVRRVSGGGTVYHDEGNLNFAIISKFEENKVNNYALFNEPIRNVLQQIGVPAVFNQRNDMIAEGKKISGNAQFTNRKNILSHGTILVNANLENLRTALKQNVFRVETKAVSSVRSSVANITQFISSIQHAQELMRLIEQKLVDEIRVLTDCEWLEVMELNKEKYASEQWRFGRSPESKIHFDQAVITVVNGKVEKVESELIKQSIYVDVIGKPFSKQVLQKLGISY